MSDYEIGKSFTELHYEAMGSVRDYFNNAIEKIDEEFGDGYSKKHPELVGAMVIATQQEFHGGQLGKVLVGCVETAGERIAESIGGHDFDYSIKEVVEKLVNVFGIIADRMPE